MEWNTDGDALCAICEKSSTMFMWDANQKKILKIDSGAKDSVTFLCWSKTDLQLALGKIFYTNKQFTLFKLIKFLVIEIYSLCFLKKIFFQGTSKGNLILYNHKIGRKVPILGKHSRKIICGSWSQENKLALGGADNLLTVNFNFYVPVDLHYC